MPSTPEPGPTTDNFPRSLSRFVDHFNGEEFWESHEVLEDAWRASRSDFYHGLILYASAFVHVQRGNPRGVIAQLRKAERTLPPYSPSYMGVNVAEILAEARGTRNSVEEASGIESDWRAGVTFPRIVLDPQLVRGNEPELTEE